MQGRSLLYVGILCICGLSALLLYSCKPVQTDTDKQKTASSFKTVIGEQEQNAGLMPSSIASSGCPVIKQIILLPEHPTVLDNITAVPSLDRAAPADIKYEYKWYINDKPVVNANGDILPAGMFNKRDRVSVELTPYVNGQRGLTCQSYFRVIHSTPPSLSLRDEKMKMGEVIELQLVGVDPDGGKITYALEEPSIPGMTIDKMTGKITWNTKGKEAGTYRFGASASNSDGSKMTKTFEIRFDAKSG